MHILALKGYVSILSISSLHPSSKANYCAISIPIFCSPYASCAAICLILLMRTSVKFRKSLKVSTKGSLSERQWGVLASK